MKIFHFLILAVSLLLGSVSGGGVGSKSEEQTSDAKMVVFINNENASPFFVEFSGHFNRTLIRWWDRVGRREARSGIWEVGVVEDLLSKLNLSVILVVVRHAGEDGVMEIVPIFRTSDKEYLKLIGVSSAHNAMRELLQKFRERREK